VEIDPINQEPARPFREIHWISHRGKGNHKKNPNNNSKIDRKDFDKAKCS
jgi:hypothetical protein